jgi:MFS family permease
MSAFASSPAALRLFVISIVARLPLAMLTIGMLVHVEAATGSFTAAGLAAGILAVAQGIGGPLLGRLADRRGQTAVLAGSAATAGGALLAVAALPADTPPAVLMALAAVLGAGTPPIPACVRALIPVVVRDPDALRGAYAVDSAAVELTWVAGPPLVLALGAAASTGAALAIAGGLLVGATMLFAATPASRGWRAEPVEARVGGCALRSPGVLTLALVLAGAGTLFGATEVAVTATSDSLGHTAAAGPLLGLWGLGGLLGGLVAARAGGGARTGTGLALLLAALAAGHLALAAVAGSIVGLGVVIVVAGMTIAPTCATAYAMVDAVAPRGAVTEAFAWMATAVAIGTSAGAALAGAVADAGGPTPAFLLAGAAAAGAALVARARARTVTPEAAPRPVVAAVVPIAA